MSDEEKKVSKLELGHETLRILDDHELEQIAGGGSSVCRTCTDEDNATCCGTDGGGGGGGGGPLHDW